MKLTTGHIVIRSDDTTAAELDGEVVMMSIEQGNYYTLDSIGARIWELIEEAMSIEDIISQLMQEYKVDRKTCEADTIDLLQQLWDKNLIKMP